MIVVDISTSRRRQLSKLELEEVRRKSKWWQTFLALAAELKKKKIFFVVGLKLLHKHNIHMINDNICVKSYFHFSSQQNFQSTNFNLFYVCDSIWNIFRKDIYIWIIRKGIQLNSIWIEIFRLRDIRRWCLTLSNILI